MSRREVRVVILYEDKVHDSFLRRLVDQLGLRPVRYQKCGDAVRVLKSIGAEVDALRAKKDQKNLGLMIVIDADEKGLTGRIAELQSRIMTDARAGARAEDERIALVVPALEVENWYVHLCFPAARPVDENRDYKPSPEWRELEKDLGLASRRAVGAWSPEPGRTDPPSILAARAELLRIS